MSGYVLDHHAVIAGLAGTGSEHHRREVSRLLTSAINGGPTVAVPALCLAVTVGVRPAVIGHVADLIAATGLGVITVPGLERTPILDAVRPPPWRTAVGHVIADVTDHDGAPLAASPRAVLRRVIVQLAERGYAAQVGVELEFYLMDGDGKPVQDGVHCYSLEKVEELDPALSAIIESLRSFAPVEAVNTEYGPAQVEVNLRHADALTAADDAFRLRYALKALARRYNQVASFMAKPFNGLPRSSAHLHVSLWKDGEPAFAPEGDTEPVLTPHVVAGLLDHLPGITRVRRADNELVQAFRGGIVRPDDGSAWTLQTVASILGNPRYTGRQVWNRQPHDRRRLPDRDLVDIQRWPTPRTG